jgi:hypothetical protein
MALAGGGISSPKNLPAVGVAEVGPVSRRCVMRKRRLSVFDENIVAEKANLVMRIANLKAKLDLLKYREPRIGGHKNIRRIVAAPRIGEELQSTRDRS